MSRFQIIALSLICCAFGGVALYGASDLRVGASAINIALAVLLFVVAGRDLTQRGWELGYLFAGAYLLPLVGLIVYVGLSNRPKVPAA